MDGYDDPSAGFGSNECSYCNEVPSKIMRCSKCKFAIYCSKDHQRADWPQHKRLCKMLADVGGLPGMMRQSRAKSNCGAFHSFDTYDRTRVPPERFPKSLGTMGEVNIRVAEAVFACRDYENWAVKQVDKTDFYVPTIRLKGATATRPNKRWVPNPGDVMCDACKHPRKVPSYYHSGAHWMLCRECAEGANLRYYAPGGGCEAKYGPMATYEVSEKCADTQFPQYIGGEPQCGVCGSHQLLVMYDEVEDEFVVCVDCRKWRQELRCWVKYGSEMRDQDVKPQVMDVHGDQWVKVH